MKRPCSLPSAPSGFLLLEVVFALLIFSISAVGLVQALQQSTLFFHQLERENHLVRQACNLEVELLHSFDLTGKIERQAVRHLGEGTTVTLSLEPEKIVTQEGHSLVDLHQLKMVFRIEQTPPFERTFHRLVVLSAQPSHPGFDLGGTRPPCRPGDPGHEHDPEHDPDLPFDPDDPIHEGPTPIL